MSPLEETPEERAKRLLAPPEEPTVSVRPSPKDRGNFTGVRPDLLSAYTAAQQELAGQGISLYTASDVAAKRDLAQQARLRAKYESGKGNLAARPTPNAPHVAGRALDLRSDGALISHPSVRRVLERHGLKNTVPSEPWHWEIVGGQQVQVPDNETPQQRAQRLLETSPAPTAPRQGVRQPAAVPTQPPGYTVPGTGGAVILPPGSPQVPQVARPMTKEEVRRQAQEAQKARDLEDRVSGKQTWDWQRGGPIRRRNTGDLLQETFNRNEAYAKQLLTNKIRDLQRAGGFPLAPQVRSAEEGRGLKQLEQYANQYGNVIAPFEKIPQHGENAPTGVSSAWLQADTAKKNAWKWAEFPKWLKKQGVQLTPHQQSALESLVKVKKLEYLAGADMLNAATKDAMSNVADQAINLMTGGTGSLLRRTATGMLGAGISGAGQEGVFQVGKPGTLEQKAKSVAEQGVFSAALGGATQLGAEGLIKAGVKAASPVIRAGERRAAAQALKETEAGLANAQRLRQAAQERAATQTIPPRQVPTRRPSAPVEPVSPTTGTIKPKPKPSKKPTPAPVPPKPRRDLDAEQAADDAAFQARRAARVPEPAPAPGPASAPVEVAPAAPVAGKRTRATQHPAAPTTPTVKTTPPAVESVAATKPTGGDALNVINYDKTTKAISAPDGEIYATIRAGKRKNGQPFYEVRGYSGLKGKHSDLEGIFEARGEQEAIDAARAIAARERGGAAPAPPVVREAPGTQGAEVPTGSEGLGVPKGSGGASPPNRREGKYWYRLIVRPAGETTTPEGVGRTFKIEGRSDHGIVGYDRPLSTEDIRHYTMFPDIEGLTPPQITKRFGMDPFKQPSPGDEQWAAMGRLDDSVSVQREIEDAAHLRQLDERYKELASKRTAMSKRGANAPSEEEWRVYAAEADAARNARNKAFKEYSDVYSNQWANDVVEGRFAPRGGLTAPGEEAVVSPATRGSADLGKFTPTPKQGGVSVSEEELARFARTAAADVRKGGLWSDTRIRDEFGRGRGPGGVKTADVAAIRARMAEELADTPELAKAFAPKKATAKPRTDQFKQTVSTPVRPQTPKYVPGKPEVSPKMPRTDAELREWYTRQPDDVPMAASNKGSGRDVKVSSMERLAKAVLGREDIPSNHFSDGDYSPPRGQEVRGPYPANPKEHRVQLAKELRDITARYNWASGVLRRRGISPYEAFEAIEREIEWRADELKRLSAEARPKGNTPPVTAPKPTTPSKRTPRNPLAVGAQKTVLPKSDLSGVSESQLHTSRNAARSEARVTGAQIDAADNNALDLSEAAYDKLVAKHNAAQEQLKRAEAELLRRVPKRKPVVAVRSETPEPWEMTQRERLDELKQWYEQGYPAELAKEIGGRKPEMREVFGKQVYASKEDQALGELIEKYEHAKKGKPDWWYSETEAQRHRADVEAALTEGKPVPKNVLADYPDLAPALPKLTSRARAALDTAQATDDAARAARLAKEQERYPGGGKLGISGGNIDLEDVAYYGRTAARMLAKGTLTAADFAEQMVKLAGEEIRPHLDAIWAAARKHWEADLREDFGEWPEAPKAVRTFRTEKGSTYTLHEDGTTTRNKAARTEHPGESGPQPRSQRTVFISSEDAQKMAVFQAKGGRPKRIVFDDKTGHVAVAEVGEDGKVRPYRDTVVKYGTSPDNGAIPLETWNDGAKAHWGNKIAGESPTTATPRAEVRAEAPKPAGEAVAATVKPKRTTTGPAKPPTGAFAPSGRRSGIRNASQEAATEAGELPRLPEKGIATKDGESYAAGRAAIKEGKIDPAARAAELARTGTPANDVEFGAFQAHAADQKAHIQRLKALPQSPENDEAIEAAEKAAIAFLDNVQKSKTRASNIFRALKGEVDLDTGDYVAVAARIKDLTDREPSGKLEAELRSLTEKVTAQEKRIADLEAAKAQGATDAVVQRRRTGTQRKTAEQFQAERKKIVDDLLASISNPTGKGGVALEGFTGSVYVGAKAGHAAGKLALSYAEEGIGKFDDWIRRTVEDLRAKGIEATHKDVVDDIVALTEAERGGKTLPKRSDLAQRLMMAKREAAHQQRLLREIETGVRDPRTPRAEQGASTAELTKRRNLKMAMGKVEGEIKSLTEQLETGKYAEAEAKGLRDLNEALENARAQRSLLDKEVRAKIDDQKMKTAGEKFMNFLQVPKSLRASFDLSAPGRQGIWLAYANPDHAASAFVKQLRAWGNPVTAERIQLDLLKRPDAPLAKRAGLYLSTVGGMTSGEEQFGNRLFKAWKRLNPFDASERAYVTYLNSVRMDAFERMLRSAKTKDVETATQIAQYINSATGRGGTGSKNLDALANGLLPVLWSPRYAISRTDLLSGRSLWAGNAASRTAIAKQYARSAVGLGALLSLAYVAGAQVKADPQEDILSTDFMKPRVGDTRMDVAGGTTQPAVATARVLTGKTKTGSGKIEEKPQGDTLIQQFRYKLAPTWSTAWSTVSGQNAVGEPFGPWSKANKKKGLPQRSLGEGVWDIIRDTYVPLSGAEIYEAGVKDGLAPEDLWTLLNIIGIGVTTYKD